MVTMMLMIVIGKYTCFCRVEDVTDPDTLRKEPKTDRSVCLYGYVRGCHYRNHTHVHIPGLCLHTQRRNKIGTSVCILSLSSLWILYSIGTVLVKNGMPARQRLRSSSTATLNVPVARHSTWVIALSLWLLHASGTVCLPTLPRPRHCWLSDGCWRQSCSVAAFLIINLCFCTVGLHSDVVWTATLTNFVRCPCSRFWLYATLIFSFIIIIIIIEALLQCYFITEE